MKTDRALVRNWGALLGLALALLLTGCSRAPISTLMSWEKDRWGACVDSMLEFVGCSSGGGRRRAALGVLVADANPANAGAYSAPRLSARRLAFDPLGWCMEQKLPIEEYAAQRSAAARGDWLVEHGCPTELAFGRAGRFGRKTARNRR